MRIWEISRQNQWGELRINLCHVKSPRTVLTVAGDDMFVWDAVAPKMFSGSSDSLSWTEVHMYAGNRIQNRTGLRFRGHLPPSQHTWKTHHKSFHTVTGCLVTENTTNDFQFSCFLTHFSLWKHTTLFRHHFNVSVLCYECVPLGRWSVRSKSFPTMFSDLQLLFMCTKDQIACKRLQYLCQCGAGLSDCSGSSWRPAVASGGVWYASQQAQLLS